MSEQWIFYLAAGIPLSGLIYFYYCLYNIDQENK